MTPESVNAALVGYVPVIHSGYLEWFGAHQNADMHVLDQDVLDDFPDLRKDIRALKPLQMVQIIEKLRIFPRVKLLGKAALVGVFMNYDQITMPDDEVSRTVNYKYLGGEAEFEPVFLRWDRSTVGVDYEVTPDRVIEPNEVQLEILKEIYAEAEKSSNIWRAVAAVVTTSDGRRLVAHNTHTPTEYTPYIDGDPRSFVKRGVGIEVTTDQHAEAIIIAEAARLGIALQNAEIHIDTICCPVCAKQVAAAGFSKCYFVSGYATLDGETVLRNAGVELVKYDFSPSKNNKILWRPYPKK